MVATLAPVPVWAADGDGKATDEDGAPGSAGGGHGPANAPRSGGDGAEGPPDFVAPGFVEGICAVGETLWVANRSHRELRAYDRFSGKRDEDGDLPLVEPARGVWCDGETVWYTSKRDYSTIFAYDLETGARDEDREFDISALDFSRGDDLVGSFYFWAGPLGIASDGDTMWVATNSRVVGNRLYALDMATKEPKPEADIALGGFYPRGLWSDGDYLWVASTRGKTVRAYDIATQTRTESLDLKVSPGGSWGLWSDGEHMWVCHFPHEKVRAHPMPAAYGPGLETLEVSGVELVSSSLRVFRGRVARGTATVTVTAVAADDAHTVTFGTDDADDGTEGHQWSLELGDNTLEITVSDGTLSRIYTIMVTKVDVDALSDDATLSSLSVDGAGVDGFAPDVHDYGLAVAHDAATATVAAAATEPVAQVEITPADADPDTEGHQVALDVGSNPVTVAVAATDGFAEAVYRLTISRPRRLPPPTDHSGDGFEGPPDIGLSGFVEGICAVGETLWVAFRSLKELRAYDRFSGERDEDGDLPLVEPPRGVWCDGETLWYTSRRDYSTIFAYDLATGTRDEDREFDISAFNFSHRNAGTRYFWSGPLGIASDGETMWVATNSRVVGNRLYALDMATKEPKPEADIALGGFYPRGLWSDGDYLWVASTRGKTVRAYDIATQTRTESLDLKISLSGAWGLWSDGEHMWVCNFRREKVRAHPMPAAYRPGLETLVVSGVELVSSSLRVFRGHVARGTASVTVTAEPFDDTDTVTFGTDDADDGIEGHQWTLELGDNTLEITVSDGTHSRTYTITVVRVDADALSDDATLSSLSVDGVEVDGFASDVSGYRVRVANDAASVTVAAVAAEAAARVEITPADADPDAEGHQVALDEGANTVRVAVAATDGMAGAVYTLTVSRMPSAFGYDGFMIVWGLAHRRSMDIWADARTRWVSYNRSGDEAVLAYYRSTGGRSPGRDIAALADGNGSPWALWSDGASLYVLDAWKSMVFQYSLDEDGADGFGAHVATVSLEGIGEDDARGLWSDGETMWVANRDDAKVYAYELDGDRVSGEDFDTLAAAGNSMPVDLWSDGLVMWVLDKRDRKIYAYDLDSKVRLEHLDFPALHRRNGWPSGLWSDGAHMWVSDADDTRAYAYVMPAVLALDTLDVSGVDLARSSSTESRGRVARGTTTVTVAAEPADSAHTVTFGTDDADPDTEGHQWSLALGDNTLEIIVSDGADSRAYTITVTRVDVDALSDDATLNSLSVDGAGVDGFASGVDRYQVKVDHDVVSATVAATAAEPAAEVTITPADADPDAEGHQVALDVGSNVVTVAVAATDGIAEAAYTLSIFRRGDPDQPADFVVRGFREGICAVGDTLWVSSRSYRKLYAYDRFSGERDEYGDLPLVEPARGVWCDGETMWYTSKQDHSTIFAYDLATGARDEDREFDISALDFSRGDNASAPYFWAGPLGIASDGETMWVATNSRVVGNRLYALDMATKEPKPEADIALGGFYPRGLWSDGEFLWVASTRGDTVRAYDIATRARVESLEFDVTPGGPWGLWSDGEHMWVCNFHREKVQVFPMPEANDPQQSQQDGTQQQDDPQQQDGTQQTQQAQQQDDPQQGGTQQQDGTQQDDPQQGGTQQQAQQAQQQVQQDEPQQGQVQQDDPQQGGTQQDDPQQGGTQQQAQQAQQQVQQEDLQQGQVQQQVQQDEPQQDEPQQDKVQQAPEPNVAATGVPVVAGAVRVGETLVVDTSGIADADGLVNVSYTYLWLADGAAVAGAAGAAYTLVEADVGKVFEVRVSFVDDRGHRESLVGAAAGPVLGGGPPGAPRGLVVAAGDRELTLSWEPPEGNAAVRKYRVEWRIDGRDYHRNRWGTTRTTTYTTTHLANGVGYVFRVTAVNDRGHGRVSEEVGGTPSSGSVVDLATPVLSGPETLHFGMVKLDWDDIDGADRYIVQHYSLSDADWQDLPAAGIDVALHGSSAVVANLGPGIWWLRVGAASCAATSEWSEIEAFYILDASDWQDVPIPAVEPGDETEPCPEVLATPVLSGPETLHYGMVKLDWDDIDGADRYIVQHYNLDDAEWQDLPAAGIDIALHGSSAVVTNLDRGIWWLRVGAASCTGTSEWSEIEAFYIDDASDWQDVPVPAVEPGDQPQPCP